MYCEAYPETAYGVLIKTLAALSAAHIFLSHDRVLGGNDMNNLQKKPWESPKLETLDVDKTLSGSNPQQAERFSQTPDFVFSSS